MELIRIGNRLIEYELKKSRKAKKVSILIKDQTVKVAVPTGFTFDYARNFIELNKDWIIKNLEKQENRNASHAAKRYMAGDKLLYRGRNYPLQIEQADGSDHYAVFKGSRIVVYAPRDLAEDARYHTIKTLVNAWYMGQAEKLLPEQVEYYAKQLGVEYKKIRIKDQRTRWGSCSNKGYINLNWRIIMAPNQVTAYVIIHELAHLKHMNHSKEFWDTVQHYLPDYQVWRKWLATNGKDLID